jgi:hypothetical protein
VRDYQNKVIRKVISLQEFIGWAKPDAVDDSIWEVAKDSFLDGVHDKDVAVRFSCPMLLMSQPMKKSLDQGIAG